MIVKGVTDLEIMAVLDRGVSNKECIAIKVNAAVNLGQYGIMLGSYAHQNAAVPYLDHLYWFGNGFVKPNDWLFVYTGSGDTTKNLSHDGTNDVYSLYWGKPVTVFAQSIIVPILFRADAVDVASPPDDLPQLRGPGNQ